MNYCRISLKRVENSSKYSCYKDLEFKKLFSSLKVNPVLGFSRKDFFKLSPVKSKGMSISGMQQKLSMKIDKTNELVVTAKQGEYILKPSPEIFPHASENEHCSMLTSKLLGIKTALCGLVSFSEGQLVYITKRFDRTLDFKIHQEDLAQGFGLRSREKYQKSYEQAGKLINDMTGGKVAVVYDFFCRIVHAYIIGNDDMHLKNISLQKLPGNTSLFYDCLTPNYDCLAIGAFENASNSNFMALDLLEGEKDGIFSEFYKKYGFYTGNDFKVLGNRLGLRNKPVENFINYVIKKEPKLIDLVKSSYMPEEMKNRLCSMIIGRVNALGS